MENWITRVQEPRALFLAWQAPEHFTERRRWAVGKLTPILEGLELRYFSDAEFPEFNAGKSAEEMRSLSYQGFPSFDLKQPVHHSGVADAFMRRLPPQSRADFGDFLRQFRLKPDLPLSPLALLARTEAKLPSDGFSIVDPLDPSVQTCDLLLEIAGFHYYVKDHLSLEIGHRVEIEPEPDNEYDSGAVKIGFGSRKIGNINRLQAPTFLRWLKNREVSAVIERLNGEPDKPRAYIFARIRPAIRAAA